MYVCMYVSTIKGNDLKLGTLDIGIFKGIFTTVVVLGTGSAELYLGLAVRPYQRSAVSRCF